MLKILEKAFGRTIGVAVVDPAKDLVTLGFETATTKFCRLQYGKFSLRIKSTDPFDLVVRLDNRLLLEKKFEAGTHTVSRDNEGKPFMHLAPGESAPFVASDAGHPLAEAAAKAAAEHEQPAGEPVMLLDGIVFENDRPVKQMVQRLFPESDPPAGVALAPTHGLLVVQVRFSHIKPDYGPVLTPDEFANVVYQLNEPKNHAKALACNFRHVLRPTPAPDGTPEIIDPAADNTVLQQTPKRTCCIACDRDHNH